ncbi:GNAT family N-acetyltransferase [Nocardia goodfellowii]|uniref:GNAT superfamily N-acetyltransferase n=1 Tax=Nocardia goodfellowii TaxID=882446 RepID=A0ABS4QKB0_9NOCA|nr:GNAT family N-acetyltransferase [Nocardia goodfellowii]MBP2192141.1 GNAT superfamily N-acetyltransferase [Nocardia goodfellowii]
MSTQVRIHRAELDELDVVARVMAEASVDEEVLSWVMKDHPDIAEQYRNQHARGMVEAAMREDEVWVAGDGTDIWAVSLWQTVHDRDRLEREAAEMRERYEQIPLPPFRRLRALMGILKQTHPNEFPHRYLQLIVTLPEHRGKGAGAAIVTERAKAAADAGLPAYLEASTERSSRLYARCGFVIEGDLIPLPEDGPVLRPMWFRG